MKVYKIKFKKILLHILIIIVSLLVIIAFYSNKHKFTNTGTIKYSKIVLKSGTNIDEIVDKYSDPENREKFVSEIKKVNNINLPGYVHEKTLIIPIFESK